MKKFFFSAVAMMAFSVESMANNIDLESEDSNFIEDYWDCAKIASDVYHELIQFFPEEEALDNANQYFNNCLGVDNDCTPPFLC